MTFGAHAGVDEDLGDGIFGGVGLLELVGACQIGDVVDRVVEADVLERVRYAADEVVLIDGGHCLPLQLILLVTGRVGVPPYYPAVNFIFSITYARSMPVKIWQQRVYLQIIANKSVSLQSR